MDANRTWPTVNARIVVAYNNGVDFHSAQGLIRKPERFVTNIEADAILNSEQSYAFNSAVPFWVGTGVLYEAPGKKLGSRVEYTFNGQKFVAEVPKRFQGMLDTALALEHPDWEMEKKGGLYIFKVNSPEKIQAVENFPREDGWRYVHEGTGIPTGKEVCGDRLGSRYLRRRVNSPWVGPLARGDVDGWVADRCRDIYLDSRPVYVLGVVAIGCEAPAPQKGAVVNGIEITQEEIDGMREEHMRLSKTVPPEHIRLYEEHLRKLRRQ